MSMHSVDDYDPSSSTPVFGGTVSQTKIQQQQQPTNDLGGSEKLVTPELTTNGQTETTTTNNKSSDNLDTAQSINGNNGSTDAHVNGQNGNSNTETGQTTQDTAAAVDAIEDSNRNASLPAAPEPALSSSVDVARDNVSSASATVADNAPSVDVLPETTTTTADTTTNENVPASATAPEATVLAESSTPDRKTKVKKLH